MIIFDLQCDQRHNFEGWFKDADDWQQQADSGLLRCPICESANIERMLSASKLTRKSNSLVTENKSSKAVVQGNKGAKKFARLQKMLGEVHDYVEQNFTDVGHQFSEKAIEMHRGETETENIRGVANADQLKQLKDEGVAAVALPPRPVDKKNLN